MNSVDSYFRMRQNGIEPSRPVIELTLTTSHLKIVDYGDGLRTEDEILDVWETFGTPHEEDDLGRAKDTTFGKFRMGRGQLFAFGRNTWRTRTFEMKTDLKTWAREYDLTTGLEDHPGCTVEVELYDALSLRAVQDTADEIAKMAQYINIDLVINGKKRNIDPATMSWDIETDDVYISKRNSSSRGHHGSGLAIYQQGVFVQQMSGARFGIEGTVISKGELQLNWARNEVMENECTTWRRIKGFLKAEGIAAATRKSRLTALEARNFVEEFSGGEGGVPYNTFFETACLPDVTGKMWSAQQLFKLIHSNAKTPRILRNEEGKIMLGFAPRGDREAEKVMEMRRAVVLDSAVLEYLRVDHIENDSARGLAAIRAITGLDEEGKTRPPYYSDRFHGELVWCDYLCLLEDVDGREYHRFSVDEFTSREEDFINCARQILTSLDCHLHGWMERENRALCIGSSALSDSWTDGCSYIAFNRDFVAGLKMGLERDWFEVGLRIARLLAYKEDSTKRSDAEESVEHLQTYAELTKRLPHACRHAYQSFVTLMSRRVGKLTKTMQANVFKEAEAHAASMCVYAEPEAALTN